MTFRPIAACLALALFALVAGLPGEAAAQASRTWVSGVGDDVNPCSRTAPCKTFAGAISKTAEGGIIDVIDPGGFGAVTITKGITIRGTGTGASILASLTNGVNVNAPGKVVNLIDLQIDGAPTANPGRIGVNVISAAQVTISGCNISGFKGDPGTGVKIASASTTRVTIKDTLITDNKVGVDVAPLAAVFHGVIIDNAMIDAHPTASIRGNTASTLILLRRSTAIQGITMTSGASLRSYGDNAFGFGFGPTQTAPLQ